MLALTHHMIVQASGPSLVQRYAVLGDDVIVSDDAPKYLELMTGFGVSISMAKSICSNEFIEFAKRVSAATDRLPVDVQKQVLTLFTDEKTSHL
jgi:hypothetical protein